MIMQLRALSMDTCVNLNNAIGKTSIRKCVVADFNRYELFIRTNEMQRVDTHSLINV